jgi:paraquat-inducible protein B
MSDQRSGPETTDVPQARTRRARFNLIWLIPIVAVAIGGYLAWRTLAQNGPLIVISFQTADGITAGQTQVRHKAVTLGTVESVRLARDMSHVDVSVRMTAEAQPYLTDQARFWVVRPRLSAGSISGLETLVSGAYIEMDPGQQKGAPQLRYTGLEQPPGVRSDEPGHTYTLVSNRLGSLGPGAPVFYRDVNVGEVLNYDLGDGTGPVHIQVFVRAPYNRFVQKDTRFWNVSGLSVEVGAQGVHVQIASLQAVLSGGVGFDAPDGPKGTPAPDGSSFKLYSDYSDAQNAGFTDKLPFEAFFTSNVRGLAVGAPVEFLGIQVGLVTDVSLQLDTAVGRATARVRFDVEPQRIGQPAPGAANGGRADDQDAVSRRLVAHGMRAQLRSGSLITGQQVLGLDFVTNAAPASLSRDGEYTVIPSVGGGIDSILAAASGIAQKLDSLPLDQIGANLNATLRAASGAAGGVEQLARSANEQLTPALRRLPAITSALEDVIVHANRTLASVDRGYGGDSQFSRELERAMLEVGNTARSVRQLADFLDRHPEALIRGRTEYGAGQ